MNLVLARIDDRFIHGQVTVGWGQRLQPDLINSGEAYKDLGVEPLCPQNDRAMICGNLAFNLELKDMLEAAGLEEGANSKPAQYVVEKAFLD